MKQLHFFLLSLLVAFITSCREPEHQEDAATPPSSEKHFSIRAGNQTHWVSRNGMIDSAHFQSFINRYYGKPLLSDTSYVLEITGDSMPETVHMITKTLDGAYVCLANIYSQERLIWSDTLRSDKNAGSLFFGEDSLYKALKPYSDFYMVFHNRLPLADYLARDVNMDENRNFFFDMLDDKQDTVYWKEELKKFSGMLICNLSFMDSDVYIWDAHRQKFVMFYSP